MSRRSSVSQAATIWRRSSHFTSGGTRLPPLLSQTPGRWLRGARKRMDSGRPGQDLKSPPAPPRQLLPGSAGPVPAPSRQRQSTRQSMWPVGQEVPFSSSLMLGRERQPGNQGLGKIRPERGASKSGARRACRCPGHQGVAGAGEPPGLRPPLL